MRIISKLHDFYDGPAAYGQNDGLIYVRDEKTIKLVDKTHIYEDDWERITVGFCGRLYRCVGFGRSPHRAAAYSIESLDKLVEIFCTKADRDEYYNNTWTYSAGYGRKNHIKYFANPPDSSLLTLFEKHKTAIFAKHPEKLVINPLLKSYSFYTVFDAHTTYQELQMYCSSGIFNEPMRVPPMSDEDWASIKGFDKYSFRKDKKDKK